MTEGPDARPGDSVEPEARKAVASVRQSLIVWGVSCLILGVLSTAGNFWVRHVMSGKSLACTPEEVAEIQKDVRLEGHTDAGKERVAALIEHQNDTLTTAESLIRSSTDLLLLGSSVLVAMGVCVLVLARKLRRGAGPTPPAPAPRG